MKTNSERKESLGRVIRQIRQQRNRTQEELAAMADISLRTVQRAEAGLGISKDALGAIASAFDVDEAAILARAKASSKPEPQIRVPLKHTRYPIQLLRALDRHAKEGGSIEIAPPDEHEFNEVIGEQILYLLEQMEDRNLKKPTHTECANRILDVCRKMGFLLFVGSYSSKGTGAQQKLRKSTLVIAASSNDGRIRKSQNGFVLEVIRDSRKTPGERGFQHTFYDWMKDQLIAKSRGEENVKAALERLFKN